MPNFNSPNSDNNLSRTSDDKSKETMSPACRACFTILASTTLLGFISWNVLLTVDSTDAHDAAIMDAQDIPASFDCTGDIAYIDQSYGSPSRPYCFDCLDPLVADECSEAVEEALVHALHVHLDEVMLPQSIYIMAAILILSTSIACCVFGPPVVWGAYKACFDKIRPKGPQDNERAASEEEKAPCCPFRLFGNNEVANADDLAPDAYNRL